MIPGLTGQSWKPEFKSQHPCKKLSMATHVMYVTPALGMEASVSESWLTTWQLVIHQDTLSQDSNTESNPDCFKTERWPVSFSDHQRCAHMHIPYSHPSHIHRKRKKHEWHWRLYWLPLTSNLELSQIYTARVPQKWVTKDWREGSVHWGHSSRRPRFNPQQPQGGSHLSITLVPGALAPSHRHTCRKKNE